MRLVCHLKAMLDEHRISVKTVAAETGFDPRSIQSLIDDEKWSLDRRNYEALMRYAFDQGSGPLFTLEHHPIWRTFESDPSAEKPESRIYRGTAQWDARIEHDVSQFLRHLGGQPQTITSPLNEKSVAHQMKERNCIFIGSPKKNPATEIALCLLAGAKPFDGSVANKQKVPLHIIGIDSPDGKPSAVLTPSRNEHGFKVAADDNEEREWIRVHWLPPEKYERWHDEEDDAAIVAVCRSPLGTTKRVTTILMIGYSGLATQSVARQLTHDGWPPLSEANLSDRKLHLFPYRFQFKKLARRGSTSRSDPRIELPDTGSWSWPSDD